MEARTESGSLVCHAGQGRPGFRGQGVTAAQAAPALWRPQDALQAAATRSWTLSLFRNPVTAPAPHRAVIPTLVFNVSDHQTPQMAGHGQRSGGRRSRQRCWGGPWSWPPSPSRGGCAPVLSSRRPPGSSPLVTQIPTSERPRSPGRGHLWVIISPNAWVGWVRVARCPHGSCHPWTPAGGSVALGMRGERRVLPLPAQRSSQLCAQGQVLLTPPRTHLSLPQAPLETEPHGE